MYDIFLSLALGGAVTACVLLLIRGIFGRFMGPRMKYYLWLVLALRLCMAVLPQLPVSVYGPVAQVTDTRPTLYYTSPESLGESFFGLELREIQPIEPTVQVQEPGFTVEDVVPVVWLTGAAALLLAFGVVYGLNLRKIKRMTQCQDTEKLQRVQELAQVLGVSVPKRVVYGPEPMLAGIISPTLVLCREHEGYQLDSVVLHELTHKKYGDLVLNLLFWVLTCLHWYDPLVWLCFHQARKDCELACDSRVLATKLVSGRDYAQTLLEEGKMKARMTLGTTAFGKAGLVQRIKLITNGRKRPLAVTMLCLVICVLTAACVLSAPENTERGDEEFAFSSDLWGMSPDQVTEARNITPSQLLVDDEGSSASFYDTADGQWRLNQVFGQAAVCLYVFEEDANGEGYGLTEVWVSYEEAGFDHDALEKELVRAYGEPARENGDWLIWSIDDGLTRVSFTEASLKYEYIHEPDEMNLQKVAEATLNDAVEQMEVELGKVSSLEDALDYLLRADGSYWDLTEWSKVDPEAELRQRRLTIEATYGAWHIGTELLGLNMEKAQEYLDEKARDLSESENADILYLLLYRAEQGMDTSREELNTAMEAVIGPGKCTDSIKNFGLLTRVADAYGYTFTREQENHLKELLAELEGNTDSTQILNCGVARGLIRHCIGQELPETEVVELLGKLGNTQEELSTSGNGLRQALELADLYGIELGSWLTEDDREKLADGLTEYCELCLQYAMSGEVAVTTCELYDALWVIARLEA